MPAFLTNPWSRRTVLGFAGVVALAGLGAIPTAAACLADLTGKSLDSCTAGLSGGLGGGIAGLLFLSRPRTAPTAPPSFPSSP